MASTQPLPLIEETTLWQPQLAQWQDQRLLQPAIIHHAMASPQLLFPAPSSGAVSASWDQVVPSTSFFYPEQYPRYDQLRHSNVGGGPVWLAPSIQLEQQRSVEHERMLENCNHMAQMRCKAVPPINQSIKSCIKETRTANGITKRQKRTKRFRTAFTTDQIQALEAVFVRQPYIHKTEREALSRELNIADRAIKIWFQNRRGKEKRDREGVDEEDNSSSNESIASGNLVIVESKMRAADQNGVVTLDQRALDILLQEIDARIPEGVELHSTHSELVQSDMEQVLLPCYDPISPASSDPISPASLDPISPESWDPISSTSSDTSILVDLESWPPIDPRTQKKLIAQHFC